MKERRRTKLASVTVLRTLILSVCIMAGIFYFAGQAIKEENLKVYKDFAKSYAETVAINVNPDKIAEYSTTGVTDEYYDKMTQLLQAMVHSAELRYLYVFIPEEKGLRYIMDSQADDDNRVIHELWEYEGTYPKSIVMDVYKTGKPEFFVYKYDKMNLAAYVTPIIDNNGKVVALCEADIIMPYIDMFLPETLLWVLLVVSIVLIILMPIDYISTKKRIIKPLEKINDAAYEIVNNFDSEEDIVIDVKTNDELEIVAHSIEKMNHKLKETVRKNNEITKEKERVNTELKLANRIQHDALPKKEPLFVNRKEFQIGASMTPAREVGGDFYDFFYIDENLLGLVIADVSGKGVPAAMFMMMSKSIIKTRMMLDTNLSQALHDINNLICEQNQESMFVTAWVGVLNLNTGLLVAANAGHEYPIVKEPDGDFEIYKDKHGFVLGGLSNSRYVHYTIRMEPHSKIFVFTDGLVEAIKAEKMQFGMERMVNALNEAKDEDPDKILETVDAHVKKFIGDAEQFDDLTMLCIEYNG